ncbi:MAG: hemerythrin domain-containing protein [Phycisphaerales bacterium]|nr:hemerythrin domain-containing protein [Phycisphaerales bacterium]
MLNILGKPADHGFDEPIGLLTDCHRRIEMFLDVLIRVARDHLDHPLEPGGQPAQALVKAKQYFLHAAPRHTADEEESLFPRMKAAAAKDAASAGGAAGEKAGNAGAIERLHDDHERADAMHARVDALLGVWLRDASLPASQAAELRELLDSLRELYRGHIAVEEQEVFPLAARMLSPADLSAVGDEMRARRGLGKG